MTNHLKSSTTQAEEVQVMSSEVERHEPVIEVDPGHEYLLASYDGEQVNRLVFMKREGEGYPFNVGHHPGTNCQNVLRALIARVKYLNRQIPCQENDGLLCHLRGALTSLEWRAARRHGRIFKVYPEGETVEIEDEPACSTCGHIGCDGKHRGHKDFGRMAQAPGESLGHLKPQKDEEGVVFYPGIVDQKTLAVVLETAEQIIRESRPDRIERFKRTKAKLIAQVKTHPLSFDEWNAKAAPPSAQPATTRAKDAADQIVELLRNGFTNITATKERVASIVQSAIRATPSQTAVEMAQQFIKDHDLNVEAQCELATIMQRYVGETEVPRTIEDEVMKRMDAVVDAAVEWHLCEDGNWQDKADTLETAIDALLELRDKPKESQSK